MKKAWLAGLLSFVFPGVGHLYLGRVTKGIVLIALYFVSLLLTSLIVGLLTLPLVWIYSIISSVYEARNYSNNQGPIS
ncbi:MULTISPECIES: DUF6677 family protein [Shouchella]|uniref:DUF6677 family protein n=1 Tax=Shouchella TaxID=2893057 RepID=UPI000BA6272B|nr:MULTISPECIES: DUF6677 family protein [Shouchella]MCM3380928.1 sugar ABC transporter permease [Shouchella rhizosphaerae]PAD17769.1 sugar ABC transporter permease [Shouchella clausii]PAE81537.1 sugar ABC transporter permease [Shouchella clausii]